MILIVCRLIGVKCDSGRVSTPRPDRQILGSVLRTSREEAGLSQEAMGALAGIHRTYVGSVERGERNPAFEILNRWLAALGLSWQDFGRALDEAARAWSE